jgi:hypothetical protein|tara:strand:- start:339 stop:650 length:312 start_codon:yes stop_codon:yes gene_type:complete
MDQLRNAIASLDLQYKLGIDKDKAVDMTASIFGLSEQEKEMMVEAVTPKEVEYIPELQANLDDLERFREYFFRIIGGYNREISLFFKRLETNTRDLNEKLTKD